MKKLTGVWNVKPFQTAMKNERNTLRRNLYCLKNTPIFHYQHYKQSIQKFSFNLSHGKLFGKKYFDKTRHEGLEIRSNKKDIKFR